ncbi:hypothetical protein GCM10010412_023180 [Nonomuraea recticatena]|uniref:Uncharacterized protein n=1 Tax=Nonomuraea recticatena TaxID=46178 RepID=A0ABN3RKH0_9ACTN
MQGGVLSPEAFQALVPVDEMLARMTEKGPDLWSENALTAPEWEELRTLATRALANIR